jgi:Putative DNA-binding domain
MPHKRDVSRPIGALQAATTQGAATSEPSKAIQRGDRPGRSSSQDEQRRRPNDVQLLEQQEWRAVAPHPVRGLAACAPRHALDRLQSRGGVEGLDEIARLAISDRPPVNRVLQHSGAPKGPVDKPRTPVALLVAAQTLVVVFPADAELHEDVGAVRRRDAPRMEAFTLCRIRPFNTPQTTFSTRLLKEPGTRERFAQTVTAFANTAGGTIRVGVDEDAEIVGYGPPKTADQITRIVAERITDPPDVRIAQVTVRDKPIHVVQVAASPPGVGPHVVAGRVLIRANGTNRNATARDPRDGHATAGPAGRALAPGPLAVAFRLLGRDRPARLRPPALLRLLLECFAEVGHARILGRASAGRRERGRHTGLRDVIGMRTYRRPTDRPSIGFAALRSVAHLRTLETRRDTRVSGWFAPLRTSRCDRGGRIRTGDLRAPNAAL